MKSGTKKSATKYLSLKAEAFAKIEPISGKIGKSLGVFECPNLNECVPNF